VASHDLQEPLRNIASFSELLRRLFQGKLTPQADQYLQWLLEAANRMSRLVRGLLAYCAVANRTAEPPVSIDCNDVLQHARSDLAQLIGEKQAIITADSLPTVVGNRSQIEQLFANLLGNALKYSKSDRAPEIHLCARRQHSTWVLSVADNGIGFDASHKERIFGIFKRLHGHSVPGTGIGLALCKAIVERHGGKIWAESKPGEGAAFFFSLPAAKDDVEG